MNHGANLFSVTGQFDAKQIAIKNQKKQALPIIYLPEHVEKIASLREGQTITAIGQICSPKWNIFAEDGPNNTVLEVLQIITFSTAKNIQLQGCFDATVIDWHDMDGLFTECKTLDGKIINCIVPAVHERLANAHPKYLIGSYVRFYCYHDGDCLIARKLKVIDKPLKKTLSIGPNKACQAWDDFIKEGKPKASAKKSRGVSARLRRSIFMRDGFKCRECGASPDNGPVFLEIDHIIPFSRGGNSEEKNLQTLCSECNGAKSDGMPSLKTLELLTT